MAEASMLFSVRVPGSSEVGALAYVGEASIAANAHDPDDAGASG